MRGLEYQLGADTPGFAVRLEKKVKEHLCRCGVMENSE
jgi:CDGSH-type Zn-finger protein